MTRIAVNGIELNVEVSGEGEPLLLLHGFTGDTTTWAPFAWPGYKSIAVDVIGHGLSDSPSDASRYAMEHAVDDLEAVLNELGVERTTVLGYSMGGRLALHFGLLAPERVSALILESASPGIEDESERQKRAAADDALAEDIERNGIEAFVDRWQAQPVFASQLRLPSDMQQRQRQQRRAGSPRGLANSLRGMGTGRQQWLGDRLGELKMPVLLLAGSLDERYAAWAGRMGEQIPGARVEVVRDAGHAVHLEQPAEFGRIVGEFVAPTAPVSKGEVRA